MRARQKSRDSRESRLVDFFRCRCCCAGSPQRWLHILSVNFRTAQFIWNVERTIVRWHKQFVNDGFDAVGVHRVKKAFRKTHLDVHVNGRHKVDSIAMRMTNANIYKMCRVFFHEPTMKPWDMGVVHKFDSGSFFFFFFFVNWIHDSVMMKFNCSHLICPITNSVFFFFFGMDKKRTCCNSSLRDHRMRLCVVSIRPFGVTANDGNLNCEHHISLQPEMRRASCRIIYANW